MKIQKPVFVFDMDGTLAEWKSVELKSEEEAKTFVERVLRRPGYYYNLKPYENMVSFANFLINSGYQVYIATCVLSRSTYQHIDGSIENSMPDVDKTKWVEKYLPNLSKDHLILIPDGENKAEWMRKSGIPITKTTFLIDDYHKNNDEFAKEGGTSIKCVNHINSPTDKYFCLDIDNDYTIPGYFNQFLSHITSIYEGIVETNQNTKNDKETENERI